MRLRLPSYFRLTKGLTLTISVIIAIILWAMLKLKNDYQTIFAFPCKIVNLPAGVQLQSVVIPMIHFRVRGEGNALLSASHPWNKDTLSLKYDHVFKRGWFEPNDYLNNFQNLPSNIKVERAIEDSISLHFVANTSKKVPIISQLNIDLAENYHLFTQPELKPDSIILYGDANILKNIKNWKTVSYGTPEINKMMVLETPLEKKEGIVCERKSISIKVSPELFTEVQLQIPIQVKDLPPNVAVVFQPTNLNPRCIVPFSEYDKLKQAGFVYLISYDSLQNKSSFIPNYAFLPSHVQVAPISIQEVNYTIRTMEK